MVGDDGTLALLRVPGGSRSVTERFREVARHQSDRPALVSPEGAYTYRAADHASDAIAGRLLAQLPGQGDQPLAVLLPQTADGLLGLLGALKTRRPVVLLDPTLPDERQRLIVEQAGATACLTDPALRGRAETLGIAVVACAEPPATECAEPPATDESLPTPGAAVGTDVAFVVFTSGSTGKPKGVVLTHDMLLNEAYGGLDRLHVRPDDRVALVLPAAFMAGLTVAMFALLNGAGLYAYDPRVRGIRELPAWLDEARVSTLHCTPALLRSLLAVLPDGHRLDTLRLVTTCGEAIHGRDVAALRPHLSDTCTFTSWSGSSEIGHLAFHPIAADDPLPTGIVPVGRPAPGKQVQLLGDDGQPVAAGQTGEVVVTSAYLSAGYWRAPEQTAARFTPLGDGLVAYRTGDLGRFDADGVLHLAGRRDAAVKIRGYLVEPAEVEAALLASPLVAEAVVVAARHGCDPVTLTAYVAPHPTAGTPAPATLRRFLRDRLPSWMVPTAIVVLPRLPRNERGKVDRVALPPPPARDPGTPPRSHWEVLAADLWSQVLDLETIGVHDDFMALGGDSLAAEELLAAVQDRLGLRLTTADLIAAPTVAEFATLLAEHSRAVPRHPTAVTLRTGAEPGLFCFAGAGGLGFSFLSLARRLPGDRAVHALQAHGLENRGRPDWSVTAAAARHVRSIRALQPHGPYLLAGHSLGGLIALEVALRLRAAGQEVPLVAILDTYLPKAATAMTFAGPAGRDTTVDAPVETTGSGRLRQALARLKSTVTRLGTDSGELWSYRLRLPLAGIVPFDGITQYGVFFEQGHLLTRLHRTRPWAGRVLLLLAEDYPNEVSTWKAVLKGRYDTHRLSCDHPSMLREPHVEQVATLLGAAIDEVLPADRVSV